MADNTPLWKLKTCQNSPHVSLSFLNLHLLIFHARATIFHLIYLLFRNESISRAFLSKLLVSMAAWNTSIVAVYLNALWILHYARVVLIIGQGLLRLHDDARRGFYLFNHKWTLHVRSLFIDRAVRKIELSVGPLTFLRLRLFYTTRFRMDRGRLNYFIFLRLALASTTRVLRADFERLGADNLRCWTVGIIMRLWILILLQLLLFKLGLLC